MKKNKEKEAIKEIVEEDRKVDDIIYEYIPMDDAELFIVYNDEEKCYQANLQLYNDQDGVCFVVPLKRYGTDPEKFGQNVHNEIDLLISNLGKQFLQIDSDREFKLHEAISKNSIDVEGLKLLESKLENNKVFMVKANDTCH